MNFSIYDAYNLRARLCVSIFLFSPILINLYLQIEEIKNISTTTIIVISIVALSNLSNIVIRKKAKESYANKKRKYVCDYFFTNLDTMTRERICSKLGKTGKKLSEFTESNDESYELMKSVLYQLKEVTRKNDIVKEENINYGFTRNLLSVKTIGIMINILLILVQIVIYLSNLISSTIFLIVTAVDIFYLIIWIFYINEELIKFSAYNYAEALFSAMNNPDIKKIWY